jgi:hypothetical protein
MLKRPPKTCVHMNKAPKNERIDDLRPEYDLSKLKGAVRGKYVDRFNAGNNLILLAPDVVEYFPDDESVNSALRSLIGIVKAQRHLLR